MTASFSAATENNGRAQRIVARARGLTLRRVGNLVLAGGVLLTLATYLLQASLGYPVVLVDPPPLARALVAQAAAPAVLGFLGLLLGGALLAAGAIALAVNGESATRQRTLLSGTLGGLLWAIGALVCLVLLPLWGHAPTGLTAGLAILVLVTSELAAPLLLALWTVTLSRQLRAHRVLGWIGAIGLLLVAARSLLWCANALLPVASGLYGPAAIAQLLSLVGTSAWLLWLLLLGFRLVARNAPSGARARQAAAPAAPADSTAALPRRRLLRGALGLVVGVAGTAFVGARTGFMIGAEPALTGDDIPAEPSLIATGYYLFLLTFLKLIYPINSVAVLARQPAPTTPPPPDQTMAQLGVTIQNLSANGVPTERIYTPGASTNRWILYLHGGGWAVAATNDHRAFVGRLSRALDATGLLPNYRLLPHYPFPAALNDCLATYRWLRQQGVPASHIVIAGESAGANLTLTTVLALKQNGEDLPAALAVFSPPTDMAMTGASYRTMAPWDPIGGGGLTQDAFAIYTNHGATNPRNPLVSPLYGDVRGFPPTLIQAATQEVFVSDAISMADRLKAAGVTVKLEVWPGLFHAFTSGPTFIPESVLAEQHATRFLRRYLKG